MTLSTTTPTGLIVKCHRCERSFDSNFEKMEVVDKYGDIALCESCSLARDENAEAEEL